MRSAQVFVSYRRDDAAGYARSIGDELARQFGADRVFIDVDDIRAGQAFSEVIEREIGASKVLLVLIGRRWLGERDGAPPRIGEPADLVRREVAAGLASGARVIPVLLDGAPMPAAAELPEDLRALPGRNALTLDNARYAADIGRLVTALREAFGEPAPVPLPPKRGWPPGPMVAGVLLFLAVLAGLWLAGVTDGASTPIGSAAPDRPASDAVASRPDINGAWQAEARYDWSNAPSIEHFDLRGESTDLHGTASFLGVPRGLLEGRVEPDGVRFVTRTTEDVGGSRFDVVHRYQGRWIGGAKIDEIRFVMQTDGSSSPHPPVEFVARRRVGASPPTSR